MIHLVKRNQLQVDKYNSCITNSIQSRIFAYSWYLDIVTDNWDVLVLNDYEAVMPLPWRRKHLITYVYPPFWLLELGIFSQGKNIDESNFIKEVFIHFNFVELRLNTQNSLFRNVRYSIEKEMQLLSLKENYHTIFSNYSRNRKRELKKAEEHGLIEKWNENPEKLITLFEKNVGKRVSNLQKKDYQTLLELMKISIAKEIGEMLTVYDLNQSLAGAIFLLKHKSTVTVLVVSTDFQNRDNGVSTFLNDRAIFKYQKEFSSFHFGGSSMNTIANYYKSFGAKTESYVLLKKRLL